MSTSRRKQGFLIYRRLTSETQTSVGCFVVSPQDQDQPKKKPMPQEGSSLMRISSKKSRHDLNFTGVLLQFPREFHRCHAGLTGPQSGPATTAPASGLRYAGSHAPSTATAALAEVLTLQAAFAAAQWMSWGGDEVEWSKTWINSDKCIQVFADRLLWGADGWVFVSFKGNAHHWSMFQKGIVVGIVAGAKSSHTAKVARSWPGDLAFAISLVVKRSLFHLDCTSWPWNFSSTNLEIFEHGRVVIFLAGNQSCGLSGWFLAVWLVFCFA